MNMKSLKQRDSARIDELRLPECVAVFLKRKANRIRTDNERAPAAESVNQQVNHVVNTAAYFTKQIQREGP